MSPTHYWAEHTPFEELLSVAHAEGDLAACLSLLRAADFAMPITEDAARGEEPPAWPTVRADDRTWLAAYTSEAAMRAATDDAVRHFRIVSLVELAAGWPDPHWGLAINPGLDVSFPLDSGAVARLAVPTIAEELAGAPEHGVPVVQKLLNPGDLRELLSTGHPRVSGYVHNALDVAHLATPAVLAETLLRADTITLGGAVNLLRWQVVGADLYRTPYGGVDERSMRAAGGWVVEEAPFIGLGLLPNVDVTIREYKVDGVVLPHGAEIWELGPDGVERRRAVLDADHRQWLLEDPE